MKIRDLDSLGRVYYWEKVQSALYILYRVSTQHLFTASDMYILLYCGREGWGELDRQPMYSREEELAAEGEGETWSRGMRGIRTRVPESTTHTGGDPSHSMPRFHTTVTGFIPFRVKGQKET